MSWRASRWRPWPPILFPPTWSAHGVGPSSSRTAPPARWASRLCALCVLPAAARLSRMRSLAPRAAPRRRRCTSPATAAAGEPVHRREGRGHHVCGIVHHDRGARRLPGARDFFLGGGKGLVSVFYTSQCDQIRCKIVKVLKFFEGLFNIRQNFNPTLANFVCSWANFQWS